MKSDTLLLKLQNLHGTVLRLDNALHRSSVSSISTPCLLRSSHKRFQYRLQFQANSSSQQSAEPSKVQSAQFNGKGRTNALEKDVWRYKPYWCQPWSILTTGAGTIAAVNLLSRGNMFWTGAAAVPVAVWWYLFLILYPKEFEEYVETMDAQAQDQMLKQLQEKLSEDK